MDRGAAKHNPRLDDEMAKETEAITRGAPVGSRAEEARDAEAPGEGQPQPDAVIGMAREPAGTAPSHEEIEHRSALARAVEASIFPATGVALAANARSRHAPEAIVSELERLPAAQTYQNIQQVWEALGGKPERRAHANMIEDGSTNTTLEEVIDLGEIALRVRDALDEADGVDAGRVDVAVSFGSVVLRGRVASAEQATTALLIAEQEAGGARVANGLTVDRSLEDRDRAPRAFERAQPPTSD